MFTGGHLMSAISDPIVESGLGSIPVAAWVTAATFILGSILTGILRYRDRKRINRDDRIDAVIDLLDGCRRIIEFQYGPHKNWTERSAAESSAQKALLKLRSRTRPDQKAVLQWIELVIDAIQFDDKWQDSDAFQSTISDPLITWIDRPDLVAWFQERISVSPLMPIPIGQVPQTSQTLLERFENFSRRNL